VKLKADFASIHRTRRRALHADYRLHRPEQTASINAGICAAHRRCGLQVDTAHIVRDEDRLGSHESWR
jgi:hypothetical protein